MTNKSLRWSQGAAVVVAFLLLLGAGGGVGMALTADNPSPSTPAPSKTKADTAKAGTAAGREAWAHTYGVDRATMPNLPDVNAASPEQQAAAADLLSRTEAATAKYSDVATAKAAGYDFDASLARAEKKHPGRAARIQAIDAGQDTPDGKMPMLHVANKANRSDGKVLDPTAPETLMYRYEGQGQWTLVGVMYTAIESYPQAPPDPGGPITRWHYHDKSGGKSLMMHVFFVPGNDLAHAYAAEMKG